MQERGEEPQVSGDGRLPGEQRQHALVDLQVAPIDPVNVGDDGFGERDVVAAERLERAVELLDDEIDPVECLAFEFLEVFRGTGGASRTWR